MQSSPPRTKRFFSLPAWAGLQILLAACLLIAAGCSKPEPPAKLLKNARLALQKGDYQAASEEAAKIPNDAAQWQKGMLISAEAFSKLGQTDTAIEKYKAAADIDTSSEDGLLARFSQGELLLAERRLSEAEVCYRAVLDVEPGNALTNERLAFLTSITNRRWESLQYFFVLVKSGSADYHELAVAADIWRSVDSGEFLTDCKEKRPDDTSVKLALATAAFEDGEQEVIELLRPIVKDAPEQVGAQTMLGELLAYSSTDAAFAEWHRQLPPSVNNDPDIWYVRGLWARGKAEFQLARQCLQQALSIAPLHRRACYSLAQVKDSLKESDADSVKNQSEQMMLLSQVVDDVLRAEGDDEIAIRKTAETLAKLGRIWEACAWAVVGRQKFPASAWHAKIFEQHANKLNPELGWIEPALDVSQNWKPLTKAEADQIISLIDQHGQQEVEPQQFVSSGKIHFEAEQQFEFVYENGHDASTQGGRMFEQIGGGVVVIDIDGDHAPDVFFPQGLQWPANASQPAASDGLTDRLYKNRNGQAFDVCENALPADSEFGHGGTAGDFNNDGFADLLVANVGQNRLYQNMGDGTFVDVSEAASVDSDSWTVSTVFCDLNGDGLSDIFDVNYLMGPGVYTSICGGVGCSPKVFEGAPDEIRINQGDGRFVELPDATPQTDGKGLGVAMLTEPDQAVSLFIANDQVPNFFLRFDAPNSDESETRPNESALGCGLAYNGHGLPLACMGVAVDDFDGNGLTDLFVTNFHNEPNSLYLQDYPGLFVDSTRTHGLYSPSLPVTGWGTQSLDANLDGWPDLAVTNGHVDDHRERGGPYKMKPQFFINQAGKFSELRSQELGGWFDNEYLGRGLARLDWNQDGLPEFVVSNVRDQASLLTNRSTETGNHLTVRLHATATSRDALGTRLRVEYEDQSRQRQLHGGDGVMACNERLVQFGLANMDAVDRLVIEWPSGQKSIIESPPLNCVVTITEGINTATVCAQKNLTAVAVLTKAN